MNLTPSDNLEIIAWDLAGKSKLIWMSAIDEMSAINEKFPQS